MPSPLRMPRRGKLVQIDLCCGIFKHLCSSSRIRIEFRYQSAEFQISRACLFRQICIFEIYALPSWEMGAEQELAIGISNRQKEGKNRKRAGRERELQSKRSWRVSAAAAASVCVNFSGKLRRMPMPTRNSIRESH